jgi:hypothetical protein
MQSIAKSMYIKRKQIKKRVSTIPTGTKSYTNMQGMNEEQEHRVSGLFTDTDGFELTNRLLYIRKYSLGI